MAHADPQEVFQALPLGWNALMGIPGGGKSRTTMERILDLQRRGALPPGPDGFLLITYSRDAARSFLAKGRDLAPDVFTKASVNTLHALAKRVLNALPHDARNHLACNNVGTLVHELRAQLIPGLAEGGQAAAIAAQLPLVKAIFVDEAQDLSPDQNETIRLLADALSRPRGGEGEGEGQGTTVEMIGDPDQTIYAGLQNANPDFLRNHATPENGGAVVRLVANHRSTAQIVALANQLRPSRLLVSEDDRMVSATLRQGRLPVVVLGSVDDNLSSLIARVQALLARPGVRPASVAILGFTKMWRRRSGVAMSRIANALAKAHVRFNIMYDESSPDGADVGDAAVPRKGCVNLVTVHASKGREWKHVFVVNFNDQVFGFDPDTDQHVENRRARYVAVTRAQTSLTLFVNDGANHGYKNVTWTVPEELLRPEAQDTFVKDGRWANATHRDLREKPWQEPDPARNLPKMGLGFHNLYDAAYSTRGGQQEHAFLHRMLHESGLTQRSIMQLPAAVEPTWAPQNRNSYVLFGKAVESLMTLLCDKEPFDIQRTLSQIRERPHHRTTHSNADRYLELARPVPSVNDTFTAIWMHHLYKYQQDFETRYRLYLDDHERNIGELRQMEDALREQARALKDVLGPDILFQEHGGRAWTTTTGRSAWLYVGEMDALSADGRTLVEFKFAKDDPSFRDMMQLVFYAHMSGMTPERLLLWNLRTGKVIEISHDRDAFERELQALYVRMSQS